LDSCFPRFCTDELGVHLNRGSFVFGSDGGYAVGSSTTQAVFGDFDGDGQPDVATVSGYEAAVFVLLHAPRK